MSLGPCYCYVALVEANNISIYSFFLLVRSPPPLPSLSPPSVSPPAILAASLRSSLHHLPWPEAPRSNRSANLSAQMTSPTLPLHRRQPTEWPPSLLTADAYIQLHFPEPLLLLPNQEPHRLQELLTLIYLSSPWTLYLLEGRFRRKAKLHPHPLLSKKG